MNDNSVNPQIFHADSVVTSSVISSSLVAEHSYCAAFDSSAGGGVPTEEQKHIAELFEINTVTTSPSSVLKQISPSGYSIELDDHDINFDGFTYSVPGDSMEDILGGMAGVGDVRTVEILSSNEPPAGSGKEIEESDDSEGMEVVGEGNKRRKTGPSYARPRRRDYFVDPRARMAYFFEHFKKLTAQIHRAMCRTGCEGHLTASFEGKMYTPNFSATPIPASTLRSDMMPSTSAGTIEHCEVDDHRYAAPMLTQKFSSSDVRDHQYDSTANLAPTKESDVELDDLNLLSNVNIKKQKTRQRTTVDRFDFVKERYARDDHFRKLISSIFYNKTILEQRTGASITLTIEYDRCSFNNDNYQNALEIMTSARNTKKTLTYATLAPKPPVAETSQLAFLLPNLLTTPMYIPSSSVVPPQPGFVTSLQAPPRIASQVSSAGIGQQGVTFTGVHTTPSLDAPLSLDNCYLGTDNPISPAISVTSEDFRGEAGGLLALSLGQPGSHSQTHSPVEISSYAELKDSSTNTEPICSICFGVGNIGTREPENVFWIRCNNPFCYDMVHASCVGFMITHASHLKQLPAFYCKNHR